MADISKIKIESSTYDLKDSSARTNISNITNYSTSQEYEIGTWIDGKTIYRKVITTTGTSANAEYIGRLQGIETLVNMFVWVEKNNYFRNGTCCYYGNLSWASQCYYNKNNGYVSIESGNDFANFKNGATIRIIMEYTKASS